MSRARGRDLATATAADGSAAYALNAGHAQRLMPAALPHLRAAGGESAVLNSFISRWKPSPQAKYGAAKAALLSTAGTLANDLGPGHVRVNVYSPGRCSFPAAAGPGCRNRNLRRSPASPHSSRAGSWSHRRRTPAPSCRPHRRIPALALVQRCLRCPHPRRPGTKRPTPDGY
ncbi:SDR family oxidoreductase [Streptomyces sp. MST-110588]|uniref:SDR family oxidoreductase n=1 Tax=Streptomyces sp. MST-110588 TaxID=2833628 RepID=UPI001F5D6810|nr:SDR family oxidoreductase [Streptomyces sp. MST-110588]